LDEINGIAQGVCKPAEASFSSLCQTDEKKAALLKSLQEVNMLPELIRMQCSMLGAWGKATPDGGLTQLRTLDFGGGPFANRNILNVHHPTESV